MVEENQNGLPTEPASLCVKRKRGRPRKDDATGSESVTKRAYRKAEHSVQLGDISVGQTVSGVLDGKFDAGYMLTVTVGNSGTVLTGVVFEQGRSVPITAANDVAPNIEMLKRAKVPIPSSREPNQLVQKANEMVMHSTESSIRLVSEDLNVKHPPVALAQSKVKIDNYPVSSTSQAVVQPDLSLRCPSSISFNDTNSCIKHIGTNLPESSASKPEEIQPAETSGKQPMQSECTTKSSSNCILPEVASKVLVSGPINTQNFETSTDKTEIKKEQTDNLTNNVPQVPTEITEHEKERTLDLLGEKAGSLVPVEASVESANVKCPEKMTSHKEQDTCEISQSLETQSLSKVQSQAGEQNTQTSPSEVVLSGNMVVEELKTNSEQNNTSKDMEGLETQSPPKIQSQESELDHQSSLPKSMSEQPLNPFCGNKQSSDATNCSGDTTCNKI